MGFRLYILSFQLGKIDWLVDLQSLCFKFQHKIASKPQKSLIASSILYVLCTYIIEEKVGYFLGYSSVINKQQLVHLFWWQLQMIEMAVLLIARLRIMCKMGPNNFWCRMTIFFMLFFILIFLFFILMKSYKK